MEYAIGLVLAIISGMLNGSFAAPLKKIKGWEWENSWLAYAFGGMIALPVAITLIYIPGIISIYAQIPVSTLVAVILFGIGWGTGSVMFGIAIRLVGFSVSYTIVFGGISAFGTLIPLFVGDDTVSFSVKEMLVLTALSLTVTGIVFCAVAGKLRNEERNTEIVADKSGNSFKVGLLVCLIAAVLCSMLNFAFHFGKPIIEFTSKNIVSLSHPFLINHTVWMLTLASGFLPFLIYCVYLMISNRSFKKYFVSKGAGNWFYVGLMTLMWFLCIVLYGIGAEKLGNAGTSVGWLILMSATVIAGNTWGILTGEWKGVSKKIKRIMAAGIVCLVISILITGLTGMHK